MKKFLSIFLVLLFTSISTFASATNSYDKYGSKTGSYRTNGKVTTHYDKYGSMTGMEVKQVLTKLLATLQRNMIEMAQK